MNHPLMRGLTLFVVMALVCLAATEAAACPSCKAALASQEAGQGDLVQGFFWSILFMMSMPFALIGTFGGYMYLLVRRARQDQNGPAGAASTVPAHAEHAAPDVSKPVKV